MCYIFEDLHYILDEGKSNRWKLLCSLQPQDQDSIICTKNRQQKEYKRIVEQIKPTNASFVCKLCQDLLFKLSSSLHTHHFSFAFCLHSSLKFDITVESSLYFIDWAAGIKRWQCELQDEVLTVWGCKMLANVERTKGFTEAVSILNIFVIVEHVEDIWFSRFVRPEERVSKIFLTFLKLLNVNPLVWKVLKVMSHQFL